MKPKASHFPNKYEATYVFSDTISRLFLTLTELANIEELNKGTQLPFLFTDKPMPLSFTYTVGEITSLEYSKKLGWFVSNKTIPTAIHETFTLISNTLDNTTLLTFEIQLLHPEKVEQGKRNKIVSGCKKVCVEMINNIEMLLQVNNENIYDYGSVVIKAPREKVWEYITNLKFMRNEHIKDLLVEGNPEEIGTTISWTFASDGSKCKSSYVKKDKEKKKWKYKMVPMEGPFQIQEIHFIVIHLKDDITFFSVYHEFKEQISAEVMSRVAKKNKILIDMIKESLERNNSV